MCRSTDVNEADAADVSLVVLVAAALGHSALGHSYVSMMTGTHSEREKAWENKIKTVLSPIQKRHFSSISEWIHTYTHADIRTLSHTRRSFFSCAERSCSRPASTVAHAAFQDLLSCGQRSRSQTPGTLTHTRRPAACHS